METLAYPHMTLAHNPQSDPLIATGDAMDTLSSLMAHWFHPLSPSSKLSSASRTAFLALVIATGSWVIGNAAIAQIPTGIPGDSGQTFTASPAAPAPNRGPADKEEETEFKPLPDFQINRDRPKSLPQIIASSDMDCL